jgi:hypothetical protein
MRRRLITSRSASPQPSMCGHRTSYMTTLLSRRSTRWGSVVVEEPKHSLRLDLGRIHGPKPGDTEACAQSHPPAAGALSSGRCSHLCRSDGSVSWCWCHDVVTCWKSVPCAVDPSARARAARSRTQNETTNETRAGKRSTPDRTATGRSGVDTARESGGYEIRTREGFIPTRFPSVRPRPLGESSASKDTEHRGVRHHGYPPSRLTVSGRVAGNPPCGVTL